MAEEEQVTRSRRAGGSGEKENDDGPRMTTESQEVTEKYAQYLNDGLLPPLDIKCVSCRIDEPH